MPRILFASLLLLFCLRAPGQDRETDSLLAMTKTGKPKEKTDALNALCMTVLYSQPDQAKRYVLQAIALSTAIDYKEGESKAWNRLGIVYDVSGNYDSSVTCYKTALDISLKSKNAKGAGAAYNNLGLISGKTGRLNDALAYYFKAMPFFEQLNNKEMLGNLHNNISLIYQKNRNYRTAINYALKALAYYRGLNDEENIGATYTNLAIGYSSLKLRDSAIYYIRQAIDCHLKTNNLYGLSIAYNNYAIFLDDAKQYEQARQYYFKALALKEELNENEGRASVYANLSDNYRSTGDKKNMLHYLLKALEVSKEHHLQNQFLVTVNGLAEFYKGAGMADSVDHYLRQYINARDSMYTRDFKNALAESQTRYETKEKELTIRSQQYQINTKNYYIIGLSSAMLFIVLLFYAFYSRYRLRQQTRLQQEIIRQQDMATKAVMKAEEDERRRVASDLHDSVGQMLSAVKLNLSAFRPSVADDNAGRFEKIMYMMDESCREVRAISHNMMPNSLLKNGLVSAIREFIGQLNQEALTVNIETSGLNERLDDDVETVLYRVVQECVNNVVKHANASRLDIQLMKDSEGIAITIEDNGAGFDTNTRSVGIGLQNLSSRIGFLKGTVDISSAKGKGTLIAIFIPQQNKL